MDILVLRMAPESYLWVSVFWKGDRDEAWHAFDESDGVLVSEPFAWHRKLGVGDGVPLLTDQKTRSFEVYGVVRDYGSERGVVMMAHTTFEKHWRAGGFSTLGVYAGDETDIDALIEATRDCDR